MQKSKNKINYKVKKTQINSNNNIVLLTKYY